MKVAVAAAAAAAAPCCNMQVFFMLLIECFIQSCCQSQIADVGNLAKLFALQICCDVHVFAVG